MSSSNPVDLDRLRRERGDATLPLPRRPWLWRMLPFVLGLAILALLAWVARDRLIPSKPVTVIRPMEVQDGVRVTRGILLQAAGWVEPDPSPTEVQSLITGTLREVLVQEGDLVVAGGTVATLIDDDFLLAVAAARAVLAQRVADEAQVETEAKAASQSFEAAIDVTADLAKARAQVARASAESGRAAAAVLEARTDLVVARRELETQEFLRQEGAVGPWQHELAEARLNRAQATVDLRDAEQRRAAEEVAVSEVEAGRAQKSFETRIEERRRLRSAEASQARAVADREAAEVALKIAELALDRCRVVAPAGGVVLSRLANPGSRVGDGHRGILMTYDPEHLRVRVDVPQGEVSKLQLGMKAEILCDVRKDRPYEGEVIRIVESADIQKVTLEVQVRVLEPDLKLKPEMLCQVRFVAAAVEGESSPASKNSRLVIPARCLRDGDFVFILAGDGKSATRRQVSVQERRGEQVVVSEGLNASDKVIDSGFDGLADGDRVSPTAGKER
ncbi:MAG: efflux RND transporter periplasmic adaptor subunit [Planctomycetes bacterium]|nr:efflux RND transporter periplasmic adaptor subunit [Planctomycetota bacterium]